MIFTLLSPLICTVAFPKVTFSPAPPLLLFFEGELLLLL
jgi:hypothetical protein